jgi:hypothetical protein
VRGFADDDLVTIVTLEFAAAQLAVPWHGWAFDASAVVTAPPEVAPLRGQGCPRGPSTRTENRSFAQAVPILAAACNPANNSVRVWGVPSNLPPANHRLVSKTMGQAQGRGVIHVNDVRPGRLGPPSKTGFKDTVVPEVDTVELQLLLASPI